MFQNYVSQVVHKTIVQMADLKLRLTGGPLDHRPFGRFSFVTLDGPNYAIWTKEPSSIFVNISIIVIIIKSTTIVVLLFYFIIIFIICILISMFTSVKGFVSQLSMVASYKPICHGEIFAPSILVHIGKGPLNYIIQVT